MFKKNSPIGPSKEVVAEMAKSGPMKKKTLFGGKKNPLKDKLKAIGGKK